MSRKNGSEHRARERAGQERVCGEGETSGWHRSEAAEDAQEGAGDGPAGRIKGTLLPTEPSCRIMRGPVFRLEGSTRAQKNRRS